MGCEVTAANLGVAALGCSLVRGLLNADPTAEIGIQTPGRVQSCDIELRDRVVRVGSVPLHYSRSLRARYGTRWMQTVHACCRVTPRSLRQFAVSRNPSLEGVINADAVIDVSAGDSFSEIYGPTVFEFQCGIKESVLAMGRPLVLAPQTIGPFTSESGRLRARRILRRCALVATRDQLGLDELRNLMEEDLDDRFVLCSDMAFGLEPAGDSCDVQPEGSSSRDSVIGINVSELLYFYPNRFGIKSDHTRLIRSLIKMFLDRTDSQILLVPHVLPHLMRKTGTPDEFARSDVEACEAVTKELAGVGSGRVSILRGQTSAPRIKRAIGTCDFFVGARMHACLAAISLSIPTATLAYSKKVDGVLGMLGLPEMSIDLRSLDHAQAVAAVHRLYQQRMRLRTRLDERVPVAQSELDRFFRDTLPAALSEWRSARMDLHPAGQAG